MAGRVVLSGFHFPGKSFEFRDVIFEEELVLEDVTINTLSFIDCEITSLMVHQANISALTIQLENKKIDSFLSMQLLSLQSFQFKKLLLSYYAIENLYLKSDIPRDASFVIANCMVRNLYFQTVKNNGNIQILDLKLDKISLFYSDLGKTDFINTDFRKAKFTFVNSKIAECFLAEADFPNKVYSENEISYEQAQLAFGQLQTAYQRQGDSVRASEYQAREIEAHYKTIGWAKHFPTKLNLLFNRISNNYGRNWAQGVIFSIAVGFLFFYSLVLSSDEFHFAWKFHPNLFDSFLKFMNPLRHFETETLFSGNHPKVTLNHMSYIWDFLGRIFVAYGYYQTIQAFRRFGKK